MREERVPVLVVGGSGGAVLLRPDRVVAWRQPTAVDDAHRLLADALGQVLAQPVKVPAPPTGGSFTA